MRISEYGFTPPPSRISVQYADLNFAAAPGVWFPDYTIGVQTIGGWWEPAPDVTAEVDSPHGDGVISLYPRLGARSITLSGWIAAFGETSLESALDKLTRARRGVLAVAERDSGVFREADVKVTRLEVTRVTPNWVRFTLSLQADDPLRYGSATQALKNGRNVLLNPGDTRAWPILEVKGPTSALTIVDSAGTFTLPAVPNGQSRIVDGRNGEVWNGNNRVFDATGLWPRVLVGGAEWTVSGIGSGSVLVRRFQAWT